MHKMCGIKLNFLQRQRSHSYMSLSALAIFVNSAYLSNRSCCACCALGVVSGIGSGRTIDTVKVPIREEFQSSDISQDDDGGCLDLG